MTMFVLLRLQQEQGALIPSPTAIKDNWKLLQSPAAAITWFENVSTVIYRFARP